MVHVYDSALPVDVGNRGAVVCSHQHMSPLNQSQAVLENQEIYLSPQAGAPQGYVGGHSTQRCPHQQMAITFGEIMAN